MVFTEKLEEKNMYGIQQAGYEPVAFRVPDRGDIILNDMFNVESVENPGDLLPLFGRKRLILKKLVKTFEFDGQTFKCPVGFDFVRVGFLKESDVKAAHYYLGCANSISPTPLSIRLSDTTETYQVPFFIFKKEGE